LLERQYQLIEVLKNTDAAVSGPMQVKTTGKTGSSETLGSKIAFIRKSLLKSGLHDPSQSTEINLQRVIGAGGFGTVYLGDWKGTKVAVKRIVLPAAMSNSERAHNMAVMEIAISSAMSHPHLVQTYTYSIKPIYEQSDSTFKLTMKGESGPLINAHELRLAMEYCDRGAASDYCRSVGGLQTDYPSLLETSLDVAKAMHHLHSIGVTHNDLKAGNVLFKSESLGNDSRGVKAKVVDFGLSVKLGEQASHASLGTQGTFTHSAPEVLLEGKSSKMTDVYAFVSQSIHSLILVFLSYPNLVPLTIMLTIHIFLLQGITLWELATGEIPFHGLTQMSICHRTAYKKERPSWPEGIPVDFMHLVDRCWAHDAASRPGFDQILTDLQEMRKGAGECRQFKLK
jgi:serine/threonine protein kinase